MNSDEYTNLSSLDYLIDKTEEVEAVIENLELELSLLNDKLPGGVYAELYIGDLDKAAAEFINSVRWASSKLSQAVAMFPDFLKEEMEKPVMNYCEVSSVEVHLEENAIYIYCPRLWSKYNKTGKALGPQLSKQYCSEIYNALSSEMNDKNYDYSKFNHKVISYQFVYGNENKAYIPDNDNVDTKHIQDSICAFLPGGDSAESCSLKYSTVISDAIKAGTYITVIEDKNGLNNVSGLVDIWSKYRKKGQKSSQN